MVVFNRALPSQGQRLNLTIAVIVGTRYQQIVDVLTCNLPLR